VNTYNLTNLYQDGFDKNNQKLKNKYQLPNLITNINPDYYSKENIEVFKALNKLNSKITNKVKTIRVVGSACFNGNIKTHECEIRKYDKKLIFKKVPKIKKNDIDIEILADNNSDLIENEIKTNKLSKQINKRLSFLILSYNDTLEDIKYGTSLDFFEPLARFAIYGNYLTWKKYTAVFKQLYRLSTEKLQSKYKKEKIDRILYEYIEYYKYKELLVESNLTQIERPKEEYKTFLKYKTKPKHVISKITVES
jgi:hypothetical protein